MLEAIRKSFLNMIEFLQRTKDLTRSDAYILLSRGCRPQTLRSGGHVELCCWRFHTHERICR
jgi:hypothetical protein